MVPKSSDLISFSSPAPETPAPTPRGRPSAHRSVIRPLTRATVRLGKTIPARRNSGARTVDNLPRRAEHRIHGCQPQSRSPCRAVRRAGRVALQARRQICARSRHSRHRPLQPSHRVPTAFTIAAPARELALRPSLQITGTPICRDSQVLTPPFCGNGSNEMSMLANSARCSACCVVPRQVTHRPQSRAPQSG